MGQRKSERSDLKTRLFSKLREETKNSILAVFFFALGLLLLLASLEKAGFAGNDFYRAISYLLGKIGYFLLPALSLMLAASFIRSIKHEFGGLKAIGGFIFFLAGLGGLEILSKGSGGVIGSLIAKPLLSLFDIYASIIILFSLILISLFIIFDMTIPLPSLSFKPFSIFFSRLFKKEAEVEPKIIGGESEEFAENKEIKAEKGEDDEKEGGEGEHVVFPKVTGVGKANREVEYRGVFTKITLGKPFTPPPLSLLERDRGKPGVGDIKANANIIKRTLQNFGIVVEMDEISIGPSVTRYALKPAEGVKLSRIVALQNDLALALAAHPIRIEAPIPGKSLVGVEIPNSVKSIVGLASLLSTEEFQTSDKPLFIALGRGISGKSHFANLGKMPHLLIAGSTGSGKSVIIHAIITSILFRNSPLNLRMIMIDPKRVELTLYNKIPHLLTPVITDAKKAILALRWAAKEMERRYDILESESVRDIESYHKNILSPALEKLGKKGGASENGGTMPENMPHIIIIIDELADIMQTYPRELEAAVIRLAQMSRAVGIHLILSTQRPSVNIITGLIKANIPARVALQVASQVDSRTILDMSGAEKLLGAGDMLYLSGEMSQPQRIQSPFIGEHEVKKVVKWIIDNYSDEPPQEINLEAATGSNVLFGSALGNDDDEIDDDLYEAAWTEVMRAGKASTSYLQRKLRIGYARAARLMDVLEERGIIGPSDGAKPREVIGASSQPETDEDFS